MHGMQHISNGRFSSVACPHYGAYTYMVPNINFVTYIIIVRQEKLIAKHPLVLLTLRCLISTKLICNIIVNQHVRSNVLLFSYFYYRGNSYYL